MQYINLEAVLIVAVALPGAAFVLMALAWLVGWEPSERVISRVTSAAFGGSSLAAVLLAGGMFASGRRTVEISFGQWFAVHDYSFPLQLFADRLSTPLILLTALLVGLTAAFSRRYLHRERGFMRFFLLLNLFGFGSLVVFAAPQVPTLGISPTD